MNFKDPKTYVIIIIAFAIVFAMNYFSNPGIEDRVQRAIMMGMSGAIGLIIGMYFFKKGNSDKDKDKFDFD